MNPNLVIFLRRSAIFMAFCLLIYLIFYLIKTHTQLSLDTIFAVLFKVFFYVVMAGMMALIIGITLKEVWSGIMSRSDSILLCCLDKSSDGVHIIASHYHSGGDSGDGYTSYRHYYILFETGKIYMSKKLSNEKDLSKSISDLQDQVEKKLSPDKATSVEVGSYEDEDDKTVRRSLRTVNGLLQINGFRHLLDYGFRLSYLDNHERLKWRRKI